MTIVVCRRAFQRMRRGASLQAEIDSKQLQLKSESKKPKTQSHDTAAAVMSSEGHQYKT